MHETFCFKASWYWLFNYQYWKYDSYHLSFSLVLEPSVLSCQLHVWQDSTNQSGSWLLIYYILMRLTVGQSEMSDTNESPLLWRRKKHLTWGIGVLTWGQCNLAWLVKYKIKTCINTKTPTEIKSWDTIWLLSSWRTKVDARISIETQTSSSQ